MNLIAPVNRERARVYYIVLQVHTHHFNIIFSDLWLAKLNIICADAGNNLTEFTFSISQHF